MFNLIGYVPCLTNLHDAAHRVGSMPAPFDDAALKDGYRELLRGMQPSVACGAGHLPELVDDPATEAALMDAFVEPEIPNDILEPLTEQVILAAQARRDPEHVALRLQQVQRGREALHQLEPSWGRLLDLMIHRFFCVDVPRNLGGSSARAVGIIWVNTPATATVGDMVEFLVHELTHHVVFLDDRLHGHYTPRAHDLREAAVSAIRGVPRPVPCVFDSLLVSVEVLSLRRAWTGEPTKPALHPPSEPLWESTWQTLQSIRAIPDWPSLFTPRGRFLLELAESLLRDLATIGRSAPAPSS